MNGDGTPRRRLSLVALGICVLAAGTLGPAGPAAVAEPGGSGSQGPGVADTCPEAFPVEQLRQGQRLSGLTVHQGTTPSSFTAEVIGVLEEAIAPGIDMVIVETSSRAIDEVGGIWYGMSGSPVYARDGRLVGAVAYGLSYGPSPVAGLTPADAMYDLRTSGTTASEAVPLSTQDQQQLVLSGAATTAEAAGGMELLPVPIGISGVSVRRAQRFADIIDSSMDLTHAYTAGAAQATGPTSPVEPGGNAAVALSYGDYTVAGVGTTTAVCGSEALLFGHPMTYEGPITMSLHSADALYVQSDMFGPYKVANPGGVVGRVTQDRTAGVLAEVGPMPPVAPVTTTLRNVSTGTQRTGTTSVVTPQYAADLSAFHVMVNAMRVLDSYRGGVARVTWSASGTADGTPWSVSRTDVVATRYDLPFMTGWEIYAPLADILWFPRAETAVTAVELSGTLDETYRALEISKAQVKVGKTWVKLGGKKTPVVKAGKPVKIRVTSYPYKASTPVVTAMTLPAPRRGWAYLSVLGGGQEGYYEGEGQSASTTLARLLARIESEPRGDDIVATWDNGRRTTQVTKRAPQFITGGTSGEVQVVR
jgi:hypothetical protein